MDHPTAAVPVKHVRRNSDSLFRLPRNGGIRCAIPPYAGYLRRSAGASPGAPDGHVHLRLVIERLTERMRATEGADPAGEAAATLRGHLAGFCSRIEAQCRESGGMG